MIVIPTPVTWETQCAAMASGGRLSLGLVTLCAPKNWGSIPSRSDLISVAWPSRAARSSGTSVGRADRRRVSDLAMPDRGARGRASNSRHYTSGDSQWNPSSQIDKIRVQAGWDYGLARRQG